MLFFGSQLATRSVDVLASGVTDGDVDPFGFKQRCELFDGLLTGGPFLGQRCGVESNQVECARSVGL